jgi:hypothetical protein
VSFDWGETKAPVSTMTDASLVSSIRLILVPPIRRPQVPCHFSSDNTTKTWKILDSRRLPATVSLAVRNLLWNAVRLLSGVGGRLCRNFHRQSPRLFMHNAEAFETIPKADEQIVTVLV